MKKIIALLFVIGFISFNAALAQTSASSSAKPATEVKTTSPEAKKDVKSCNETETKKSSCCKSKSKASCCTSKNMEKAEAKENEKVKGAKD